MGSPFGIRKKLKAALKGATSSRDGWEPPSARPKVPFTVVVVENDGSEQTTQGTVPCPLIPSTFPLDQPLQSGCRDNSCTTCRVEVLEGAELLSEQGDEEREALQAKGHPPHLRLACRVVVREGGTVRVRAVERVLDAPS